MGTKKVGRPGVDLAETDEYPIPNLDDNALEVERTETNHKVPISARVGLRPTLTVVVGVEPGLVMVCPDTTVIGRAGDCNIVVADSGVSRHHARLARRPTGYVIEDLGSKNGTFLNGRRVSSADVRNGDELMIGPNVTLRFALMGETEEALARQLYESSTRDALTRVHNRRYFNERLATELAYALRHGSALSVAMFDFDHFKLLNDTYGHAAGDAVLKKGAATALHVLRAEDVVARIGGEEFAIILRGIGHADALACAERVRSAIERAVTDEAGASIRATVSIGVASLDDCVGAPTADALVAIADRRLYEAKGFGRNRVCGRE